jgi:hypothetical protein
MIGAEGLQPGVLYSSNYGFTHPVGPVPLLALLIVPLLQACSRAWLRAGRDAACWVTLTPRSSRSLTSSVASGDLSHHPLIQGVTIPLDS